MLFDAASSRRLWEWSWFGGSFCCITRHEVTRCVSKSLIVSDSPGALSTRRLSCGLVVRSYAYRFTVTPLPDSRATSRPLPLIGDAR